MGSVNVTALSSEGGIKTERSARSVRSVADLVFSPFLHLLCASLCTGPKCAESPPEIQTQTRNCLSSLAPAKSPFLLDRPWHSRFLSAERCTVRASQELLALARLWQAAIEVLGEVLGEGPQGRFAAQPIRR
ncbi:hypothetical protein VTJ04DRAFT_484 [Mycothermus thermophilus]|uniref:uncharacterized protein n=1 Tax=Humicola insolens TaxID=85995 RepID=UPI0037432E6B